MKRKTTLVSEKINFRCAKKTAIKKPNTRIFSIHQSFVSIEVMYKTVHITENTSAKTLKKEFLIRGILSTAVYVVIVCSLLYKLMCFKFWYRSTQFSKKEIEVYSVKAADLVEI